jgi:ribosomal protein S18 acetylase RimI-like enzyme
MIDQITIRPARRNEVKVLQDLNDEIMVDNPKYDSDLRLEWAQAEDGGKKYYTELVNNPEAICLLAEVKGRIAGYVAAAPKEYSYRKSRYIEIENIGVTPEFRASGVGSSLIDACLQIARIRGFQKAYVTSYFQNTGAISFYKRSGFGEIDISLEKEL